MRGSKAAALIKFVICGGLIAVSMSAGVLVGSGAAVAQSAAARQALCERQVKYCLARCTNQACRNDCIRDRRC